MSNNSELLVLSEELNQNTSILIYEINFNEKQIESTLLLESTNRINLPFFSSLNLFSDENNSNLTNRSNLFVICLDSQLLFIDLKNKNILVQQSINNANGSSLKYFLSPTNLILTQINNLKNVSSNSDNLVGLGNLNNLIFINFDIIRNKVTLFDSNEYGKRSFVSFRVNESKLIAYDKLRSMIVGYNLNDTIDLFKHYKFQINTNSDSILDAYGLSSDSNYFYINEYQRILKLYRWNDFKKISEIKLYSKASNVFCTSEYVCMSMQDRKLISYLISDPFESNNFRDKIAHLESRSDSEAKKYAELVDKMASYKPKSNYDIYSSDEFDDKPIKYKNNEIKKSKFLLNSHFLTN